MAPPVRADEVLLLRPVMDDVKTCIAEADLKWRADLDHALRGLGYCLPPAR